MSLTSRGFYRTDKNCDLGRISEKSHNYLRCEFYFLKNEKYILLNGEGIYSHEYETISREGLTLLQLQNKLVLE